LDQHQNVIASRGSPFTPRPCLPSLVDNHQGVREPSYRQMDTQTDTHGD